MLFKDLLLEKLNQLSPEFDRLFEVALRNQKHTGDLLLILQNAFYNHDYQQFEISQGKNQIQESENTHYSFVTNYWESHLFDNHKQYIDDFKNSRLDSSILKTEALSIHMEAMIYLKFWESEMTIKRLYQFVRILQGENYDWFFKLAYQNSDIKNNNATALIKSILEELIRDKIESVSPLLFSIIKTTYDKNLRNSIAHSNFSFLGRRFCLNNVKSENERQSYSFDEWADIFSNTIILYKCYLELLTKIRSYYKQTALENNLVIPYQRTDKSGKIVSENFMRYSLEHDRWYDNLGFK